MSEVKPEDVPDEVIEAAARSLYIMTCSDTDWDDWI
jgi:hypothetical protein